MSLKLLGHLRLPRTNAHAQVPRTRDKKRRRAARQVDQLGAVPASKSDRGGQAQHPDRVPSTWRALFGPGARVVQGDYYWRGPERPACQVSDQK